MTYQEYSKLSKELSTLLLIKHKTGYNPTTKEYEKEGYSTKKELKRLNQIVELLKPYAF